MEYPVALSGSDGCHNLFVIIIDLSHIQMDAVILLHLPGGILNHGQRPKSQKIHFQKPKFL